MADPVTVTVERRFAAAPEAVFDAWLDPAVAGRWLFATPDGVMEKVEIDAHVGGRFLIAERRGPELAEHFGTYEEIDRPRRLVLRFATSHAPEAWTRIVVEIAPDGDGARLTLTHEGVWADFEDKTRQGWGMVLEGLARALDGDSCRQPSPDSA
jgi:uncharacterized protein YndB with AHSA1/START domain